MFFGAMIAAALMLADATPAAAPAAAPAATPAVAAAAPATEAKKPRLICRTEQVTGSIMPKKTCYREDQAAERKQEERQNLERIQSQLSIRSN